MCDALCVATPGGMLFAKSSDRHPDEVQVVEWHDARPARTPLRTQYLEIDDTGAFGVLGSRPTWLWGMEHGVNEHAVAVGNEKIWTTGRARAQPVGLLGMDLVRLALERARSADEALDVVTTLLEHHGQGGSGEPHHDEPYFSSFLIVDPRGGWVLETCARTWAARPVGASAAISNRITLRADWTRASADVERGTDFDTFRHPAVPTALADRRLAATRAAAARTTDPRELVAALRDHGEGPWGAPGEARGIAAPPPAEAGDDFRGVTVCMHRRETHAATTASMVAALTVDAPPRAWACLGSPCCGVYLPVFPPDVTPAWSDPATWSRFASLRDRVEAGTLTLDEVRGVLGPVEDALWADGDDVFASGDPARRGAFAERAFAPVDRALRQLGA